MDEVVKVQYSSKVAAEMGCITPSCTDPNSKNQPDMKKVADILEHIQHMNIIPDRSSTNSAIANSTNTFSWLFN